MSGWIGMVAALAVAVMTVARPDGRQTVAIVLGCGLAMVLIWSLVLRPRVVLKDRGVLLRNVFVDTFVPYGLIRDASVRSVTTLFVRRDDGDGVRRYVGIAVGRTRRQMSRTPGGAMTSPMTDPASTGGTLEKGYLEDLLQDEVNARAARATPGGTVTRSVAWLEVAGTVALAVALVLVTLL